MPEHDIDQRDRTIRPDRRAVLLGGALVLGANLWPAHAAAHKAEAKSAQSVWDWSAIDSNKDHLIEPAEMEKFLAEHPGPLKK